MEPKDEIKAKLDIVEVVQDYVQLKPAGSGGAFKAACPFHREKSPSFTVSRSRQTWHCFGCSQGGDMFSFVMQIEACEFPEALRILGKKAGVEIARFTSTESNAKKRLLEMHDLAARFYAKFLADAPAGQVCRDYVAQRGITPALIEKFGLGYVPEAWDTLTSFLKTKGYADGEMVEGGLALRRKTGSGVVDRFRGRLMVPLRDVRGAVVGFTARVINNSDPEAPKYMNSPETAIYHKGELVFGLDLAKHAVRDTGCIVIVEGNLDVIASHKASVENVVASSGTALTEAQLSALKRFTDTIIFSFDQDAAGFAAAQKGIGLAQSLGLNVKVALLPREAGKDPDEAVQKDPELWRAAVTRTIPIMEYFFSRAVQGKDLSAVEDKREVGKFLLTEIARLDDGIEREHWLSRLAAVLSTDIGVLREMLTKARVALKPVGKPAAGAISQKPSPAVAEPTIPASIPFKPTTRWEKSALFCLALWLQPAFKADVAIALKPEDIPAGALRELYTGPATEYNPLQLADSPSILLREATHMGEQLLADTAADELRKQLNEQIGVVRSAARDAKRVTIEAAIRLAEAAGDSAQVQQLLIQYNALLSYDGPRT